MRAGGRSQGEEDETAEHEDPTGGFTHGGWATSYFDDAMMARMAESGPYELLLGRGTYEIFAAHWPYDEGPIADHLNSTRKHVASRTLDRVEWSNSTIPAGLNLVESTVSSTGVTINAYERAGDIDTGSFAFEEPTAEEVARRERLASG